jgi:hypothetical protein
MLEVSLFANKWQMERSIADKYDFINLVAKLNNVI